MSKMLLRSEWTYHCIHSIIYVNGRERHRPVFLNGTVEVVVRVRLEKIVECTSPVNDCWEHRVLPNLEVSVVVSEWQMGVCVARLGFTDSPYSEVHRT